MQGRNGNADVEERRADVGGGGELGDPLDIHTPPWVKPIACGSAV